VAMDVSDAKGNKEIMIRDDVRKIPYGDEGCQFLGTVQVKKVAGDVSFAHEGSLNIFSFHEFLNFNSSHRVNHLKFGPHIPNMETPLINVDKIILNNGESLQSNSNWIEKKKRTDFYARSRHVQVLCQHRAEQVHFVQRP
jgi:hypothetical protein